ncbi:MULTISPECIES: ExbD/TolR family protein [Pseudomonas syringae group]|uniref:TonB system transport protein ExbD n=3 Tax=Pseudomonas syringae group TaxID=136849 RepID=F3G9Z3_PSESJ|nr:MULTISPECIES: biopolymer transporter ExbD [Pseudomonas syringae group]EGH43893.1 TonB system transport protein ExbD [Pseudomonas syringae pv. pisi str. 1704B]AZG88428.1 biopolymer transporter ExbD [Pseudomonas syringae pv. pisi str. PP1]PYD11830.1 biopolymer transporter ExbD [Pseudomonas syringae pv. pisi]PYD31359.1 biopolymer transporter ExbD [Pseudomonas syringae pv. pisi]PYD35916.1 biopolymer transporter ExbD [Pseudomonas syringae pv. pisi]
MSFSTSNDDDAISDINITPLVDVMLVLLVTFIVTAPLLNNAIPLDLPQTVATTSLDQADPVVVSVDASGSVFIDTQAVALEQLPEALQTLHSKDPDVAVSLRADQATGYGRVAQVLADVQKAGISRLSVITESP